MEMKFEWNTIEFRDCLDKEYGLDFLIQNNIRFTYCFTDPPFNREYGEKRYSHRGKGREKYQSVKYDFLKDHTLYADKMTDEQYLSFCKTWFSKLKQLCDVIVIYCGVMNQTMWIGDIEKPYGICYLYQINGKSMDSIAYLSLVSPILIYGKPKKRLKRNVFAYIARVGWLKQNFSHPCPLNPDFWFDLISQLTIETDTVLDIFMGTGMTARVCKQLGNRYYGYEKYAIYQKDIEYNLNSVIKIKRSKQQKLLA